MINYAPTVMQEDEESIERWETDGGHINNETVRNSLASQAF